MKKKEIKQLLLKILRNEDAPLKKADQILELLNQVGMTPPGYFTLEKNEILGVTMYVKKHGWES
jgi:hypothetical protein